MPAIERPAPAPPRCERRDVDSVEAFVRAHQAGVWRFLRVLGCPPDRADDLMQETMLVGLRRGLHAEERSPRPFLFATAKNLWLREERDRRREHAALTATAEAMWIAECGHDDGAGWLEDLAACTAILSDRSRAALEIAYSKGGSREALAAELGISKHGARTLLQRLRQKIRECIERRRAAAQELGP